MSKGIFFFIILIKKRINIIFENWMEKTTFANSYLESQVIFIVLKPHFAVWVELFVGCNISVAKP